MEMYRECVCVNRTNIFYALIVKNADLCTLNTLHY